MAGARAAVCLSVAALALAACGDDPEKLNPPEPAESVEQALDRLRDEVGRKDCRDAREVFHSSFRATARDCRELFADLDLAEAEPSGHGAGGVLYFSETDEVVILALDRDRRFRAVSTQPGATAGTHSEASDEIAARATTALKEFDCDALKQISYVYGDPEDWCGSNTVTDAGTAVRDAERPRLRRQGGSHGVLFYGLHVSDSRYFTLVLLEQEGGGFQFIDVLPA